MSVEYFRHFVRLSRQRTFTDSGAPHPISFETLDRYALRFEIEDFEDFYVILSGIDEAYLKEDGEARRRKRRQEKAKRGRKAGKKK